MPIQSIQYPIDVFLYPVSLSPPLQPFYDVGVATQVANEAAL